MACENRKACLKIAEINMMCEGSTGKIMLQIAQSARIRGHEVRTFSPKGFSFHSIPACPTIEGHTYYGSYFSRGIHTVLGMITGGNGLFSIAATEKLLREMDEFQPDVIHLHNLHQYCINLPMLFGYIKKKNIRTVWTLHDCWSFTGHCPHFDYIGCEKWKTGCSHCPQLMGYPRSYVDHSKWMYRHKKKWFTGVRDLTIVTPSQWLAELVKVSFLKDYPIQLINNGIDLAVFKPTPSDFCKKYGIENKKVILGVAFDWGERKGLDAFVELEKRLDPEQYQIVLVGTDDSADERLPEGILSIHRTQSQTELAEIYTVADVFVNPTKEENYPTVNMEAIACGTPVVTYRTGGSPEILDEGCGCIVEKNDISALEDAIIRMCENKSNSVDTCVDKARRFDKQEKFDKYIDLYEQF